MSTIYCIRHGQASFGKENYDALSTTGKEQSYVLGAFFVRRNIIFDSIYTGTLSRHEETEKNFRRAFSQRGIALPEVQKMAELNEYDSHAILKSLVPELLAEGAVTNSDVANIFIDRKAFQRVFEAAMLKWASASYRAQIPSWSDFVQGVYRALDVILQQDGRGKAVAVITSGGPISVAVRRALSLSDVDTMRVTWQIKNASFSKFKCTHESIMVESFNEVPHLEEVGSEMITYR